MYDSRSWNAFCDTMNELHRQQDKLKAQTEELAREARKEVGSQIENAKREEEAA